MDTSGTISMQFVTNAAQVANPVQVLPPVLSVRTTTSMTKEHVDTMDQPPSLLIRVR